MGRLCKAMFFLTVLAISACSNNPSSPNGDNATPPTLPDLSNLSIALPQNAPADIQLMIFAANSLTGTGMAYLNFVTATQPTLVDGKWVWQYSKDGLTITLTATEQSDSLDWQLTLDGTEPSSGTQFNNWTAMTGTSTADGLNGYLTIYEVNSANAAGNATWTADAQGNANIDLTAGDLQVQGTGNADASGSLVVFQAGVKIFESSWTSAGGSWTSYDPTTGAPVDSDTWVN